MLKDNNTPTTDRPDCTPKEGGRSMYHQLGPEHTVV